MKCVVTSANIKVFARAVHALARIGEELYVEPSLQGVSFRTVNSCRSAFATFFFGESFFSQYDSGCSTSTCANTSNAATTEETSEYSDSIKCKVAMKAFLNAFKSISSVEKNVEKCKITLDGGAARLTLQLWCRHSVHRTHNLAFIECETLKAVFDETACTHHVTAQSRLLSDVFVNFQPGQDEVSLFVSHSSATVRNYVDDEPDLSKVIRTELHLESNEFDEYDVETSCEVVFCLKELRALLSFSEPVNLPVTAQFSQPGSPIIFGVYNRPLYECKFVLATLIAPNQDTQTTAAAAAAATATVTSAKCKAGTSGKAELNNHTVTHHNNHSILRHHGDSDSSRDKVPQLSHSQIRSSCPRKEVSLCQPEVLRGNSTTSSKYEMTPHVGAPSRTRVEASRTELPQDSLSNGFTGGQSAELASRRLSDDGNMENRIKNGESDVSQHSRALTGAISTKINQSLVVKQAKLPIVHKKIILPHFPNELMDVEVLDVDVDDNDVVHGSPSPPDKKRRHHFLFNRCFNSTFDPRSVPGHDVILAEDSD